MHGMKVNIFLNSCTKFPLNNSQRSKALKFNRQLLKLEKKVNRQSQHPIETLAFIMMQQWLLQMSMFSRKAGST